MSRFIPSPYSLSHANPSLLPHVNPSDVKAAKKEAKYCTKAEKAKGKYDTCRQKRLAKGKSVYPDTERKKFLGMGPADCEADYKKWQKYAKKCGAEAELEVESFAEKAKQKKGSGGKGGGGKGGGSGAEGSGTSAALQVTDDSGDSMMYVVVGLLGLLTVGGGGYYWYSKKSKKSRKSQG